MTGGRGHLNRARDSHRNQNDKRCDAMLCGVHTFRAQERNREFQLINQCINDIMESALKQRNDVMSNKKKGPSETRRLVSVKGMDGWDVLWWKEGNQIDPESLHGRRWPR